MYNGYNGLGTNRITFHNIAPIFEGSQAQHITGITVITYVTSVTDVTIKAIRCLK